MRILRRLATTVALAAVTLVVACSGGSTITQPAVQRPSQDLLGGTLGLLGPTQVRVLERRTPLAESETDSEIIGPEGGVLRLPDAGLTVYVPPLAVTTPTLISVTAPAGNLVGYDFAPEGLHFRHDLTAVQSLTNTDATLFQRLTGIGLEAAYFQGSLKPVVDALQILDLRRLLAGVVDFEIPHFSGYVIATD